MSLSPQLKFRLTVIGAIASTATALLGALSARDYVRLVDILALFFGGVGAGAGLVAFLVQKRAERAATLASGESVAEAGLSHTPSTLSWQKSRRADIPPPSG